MSDVTLNPLECALGEAQAFRGQVDALQAENAKLKADMERMFQANVEKNNEVLKLLGNNAKLRELAKLTYAFFAWADGATFSDGTPAVHAGDRREVEDRMRELGIDADGVTMARLRSDRTAPRVIVADGDTDCATGHCECGGCGGAIDCWDRFCRHCGARMEDAQ